jgi:hypothetical protein
MVQFSAAPPSYPDRATVPTNRLSSERRLLAASLLL